jgi:mitochondrial fission protein ELM1
MFVSCYIYTNATEALRSSDISYLVQQTAYFNISSQNEALSEAPKVVTLILTIPAISAASWNREINRKIPVLGPADYTSVQVLVSQLYRYLMTGKPVLYYLLTVSFLPRVRIFHKTYTICRQYRKSHLSFSEHGSLITYKESRIVGTNRDSCRA